MIIKKGVVLASKFNEFSWPDSWQVNDWKTITHEGQEYKLICFFASTETNWAESQFVFCGTQEQYDTWFSIEQATIAREKGLLQYDKLIDKVKANEPNAIQMLTFINKMQNVKQLINIGSLVFAKEILQTISTDAFFTQELKEWFAGVL